MSNCLKYALTDLFSTSKFKPRNLNHAFKYKYIKYVLQWCSNGEDEGDEYIIRAATNELCPKYGIVYLDIFRLH